MSVTAAIGSGWALGSYFARWTPPAHCFLIAALCGLDGVRLTSLKMGDGDGGWVVQAGAAGSKGGDLAALVAPLADRTDVSSLELT
ncbi:MAG: hypothetical protein ACRD1K_13750 [Acidimicrobiales bacterium]